jgi:alcohol dehydrogenase
MGSGTALEAHRGQSAGTMRAVAFAKYGLDQLRLVEAPKPVASREGQVLIKVRAAALNPIDKVRVSGGLKMIAPERAWPAVVGYDASGVVEAVGPGVRELAVGDRVYVRLTNPRTGALGEYCVDSERLVAKMPSNATFEQAAALPLAAVTAMQALRRLGVKKGSKVLITGGAGGVGTVAVQLAKHVLGAATVATTCSGGDKAELVRSLGADVVVDYKKDKFWEQLQDYDAAFDTTGESAKCVLAVRRGGKVVTIAGMPTASEMVRVSRESGKFKSVPVLVRFFLWLKRDRAALANSKRRGVDWSYLFLQPSAEELRTLNGYVEAGHVSPVIDAVHDLPDFDKSWQRLLSGRSRGKNVLRVSA